jgi:hypothetical protein
MKIEEGFNSWGFEMTVDGFLFAIDMQQKDAAY